jgi:hypothetical protein
VPGYCLASCLPGWSPGLPLPESGAVYVTATKMPLVGIIAGRIGCALAGRSPRQSI